MRDILPKVKCRPNHCKVNLSILRKTATPSILLFFALALNGCGQVGLFVPGEEGALDLTVSKTSLHVGESTQIEVRRKLGMLKTEAVDISKVKFFTTDEGTLVVEPDGEITCVGTNGEETESAIISANIGKLRGILSFDLHSGGIEPTLNFVAAETIKEGEKIPYQILRRTDPRDDLAGRSKGTIYTEFFGSGVPNDPSPGVITGGPNEVNFRTFLIDDVSRTITAPDSIGNANAAHVVVFVRNGSNAGWHTFRITHRERTLEEHLQLHKLQMSGSDPK